MDRQIRKQAQKKVNFKKGVYIHFTVSLAVIILLIALGFILGGEPQFWLTFSILPVALGFFIHYVIIFGLPFTNIMTEDWEQEELNYEMWKLYQKSKGIEGPSEEENELDLKILEKERRTLSDKDFV